MPWSARPAAAQALNFAIDATTGTGVRRSPGPDGDAISKRNPAFFDLDVGAVFDHDWSSEWGAGFTFQLEDQAAIALTPQVRLVRGEQPWNFLIGGGVPVYVTPATLYGIEMDAGGVYTLTEMLGAIALVEAEYFFAGEDLPKDGGVLMFNFGVGLRVLL